MIVGQLVAALGSPFGHDPQGLRERAEELLSQPPFTEQRPGLIASLWQQLRTLLAELLRRFLEVLGGSGATAWVVLTIGTLLLAALVWRLTRTSSLQRVPRGVPERPSVRTAAAWHQAADDAAARGDLREALRCRYAALVTTLQERGVVDDVPGRTIRELDAEVSRNDPALAQPVAAAGQRVQDVLYGGRAATEDDLVTVGRGAAAARSRTSASTASRAGAPA